MKRTRFLVCALGAALALAFFGCKTDVEPSTPTEPETPDAPTFTGTAYTELPAGTNGTAGKTGTYVNFGDWPQTIKAASVTVDESKSMTRGAFTYFKGSDGAWYAKLSDKYYKVEPIKWRVLTDNYNGKKLLLAESILINCAYYDNGVNKTIDESTVYPNNYKESRVRAYLNGLSYTKKESDTAEQVSDSSFAGKGFLQTAFTESAQNQIAATMVDNSASSTTDSGNNLSQATSYSCETTNDKVFLLSELEATKSDYGFAAYDSQGSGNSRIRTITDYTKANVIYQLGSEGYCGWWWLRSPRYNDDGGTCVVQNSGNTFDYYHVNLGRGGVVPALCIN